MSAVVNVLSLKLIQPCELYDRMNEYVIKINKIMFSLGFQSRSS